MLVVVAVIAPPSSGASAALVGSLPSLPPGATSTVPSARAVTSSGESSPMADGALTAGAPSSIAIRRAALTSTGSFGSSGVPLRRRRSPEARAAPAANAPRTGRAFAGALAGETAGVATVLVVAVLVVAFLGVAFFDPDFFGADFFDSDFFGVDFGGSLRRGRLCGLRRRRLRRRRALGHHRAVCVGRRRRRGARRLLRGGHGWILSKTRAMAAAVPPAASDTASLTPSTPGTAGRT